MSPRTPARSEADAILALLLARDVADVGRPDCTLDDVHANLDSEHAEVLVVDRGDALAGVAVLDERGAVVSVHPDHEQRGVGTVLREAVEARARERGAPVQQGVMAANTAALAHLEAAGYVRESSHVRLRGETGSRPRAAGVAPFDLDADGPAVHELLDDGMGEFGAVVARSYDAFREGVERASEPGFRLALRESGSIAGAILGQRWDDGVGFVAELAVAREARGLGHGRALIESLLGAFHKAGLTTAELSVREGNLPALALYASLGLREDFRQERWILA